MQSDSLTLKQAAAHLKLDERAVDRLAQQGELVATRVARQWQFQRADLDAWQSRQPAAAALALLPAEATGLPAPITVAGVITADRIAMNLLAAGRDGVLHELVALIIPPHEKRLAEMLFKALKAREELCSTCVNEGVAIPHSRNALIGVVDRPVLAYGRHVAGVDFGGLDGKPVHHFFLLCAPNVREHLQLLARLTRLVHRAEFRQKLSAARQPEDVLALIRVAEESLG